LLKQFFNWLSSLFRSRDSSFVAVVASEPPANVEWGKLYLIGEDCDYWLGMLKCPCNCGAIIKLPMTKGAKLCWQFTGTLTRPTLSPSIWRSIGCKSHFIFRAGAIKWCAIGPLVGGSQNR